MLFHVGRIKYSNNANIDANYTKWVGPGRGYGGMTYHMNISMHIVPAWSYPSMYILSHLRMLKPVSQKQVLKVCVLRAPCGIQAVV